jgi:DNA-directed RNA polymerase specialized sigma24 family protein
MPDRAPRHTLTEQDEAYIAKAAERYARRTGLDPEDVAQRIMLAVPWGIAPRVGERRWSALRAVSVANAIAGIHREDHASKRAHREPERLPDDGGPEEVGRLTEAERVSLRIDLEIGLAREGERVRELCELLKVVTIAEASRIMGISRTTATGWLAGLRDRLEAKGLAAYVRE